MARSLCVCGVCFTGGWLVTPQVIETNLTGTFMCCREAYNVWMRDNGGVIVNIIADMFSGFPGMAYVEGDTLTGCECLRVHTTRHLHPQYQYARYHYSRVTVSTGYLSAVCLSGCPSS